MRKLLFPFILLTLAFTSCDDTTETIGGSLTDVSDMLDIMTAKFPVTSESVVVDSVLSRSTQGYLGKVKDPETDTYVTCNLMTQFHVLEGYELFPPDSMLFKDGAGKVYADSCDILISYNSFYGDSLALMKLTLHEMDHPMEENQNYYSSYSPAKNGYLRKDGIHKSKTYTIADQSFVVGDSYVPYFKISLNDPYTDKDGVTYSNYGTYILRKYNENPKQFATNYDFLHKVCPGFYIESTNGVGNMTYLYTTQLNVYYRYTLNDTTTVNYTSNFSGTEEVLQCTDVTQDKSQIEKLAADGSCTYLKTPSGIMTRITLPVDEVMRDMSVTSSYELRKDTLSTARMTMKRLNNTVNSKYNLPAPQMLLMVSDTLKTKFFEKGMLPDGKVSALVSFNSSANTYDFPNLSSIVTALAREKRDYIQAHPGMTSESYNAKFPNWNKMVLIPVTTRTSNLGNQDGISSVRHDMSLTSARLVGGKDNPDAIQLSVIYSKFRSK